MEHVVLAVGLKEIEADHVPVRLVVDARSDGLGLAEQIAAAGDDVELSGAELVHPGAGFQHLPDFDAVIDRATEQRIPAIRNQDDELLGLPADDTVWTCRQRLGAEAVERLL